MTSPAALSVVQTIAMAMLLGRKDSKENAACKPSRPTSDAPLFFLLSSFCHGRMFLVARALCYPQPPR
jgi:hypothetical protein